MSIISKSDNVQHNYLSLPMKKRQYYTGDFNSQTNQSFFLIAVLAKNTQAFSILLLTQSKEIDTQGESSTIEPAYRKMILYYKRWILRDVDLAYLKYTLTPHRHSSYRAILNFPYVSTFKWVKYHYFSRTYSIRQAIRVLASVSHLK